MAFAVPYKLQESLAKVLGLDVGQLTRILVDVTVEQPARFRVTGYLTEDQQNQLTEIFATVKVEVVS